MSMKRCFLFGHRDAPDVILKSIIEGIEWSIANKGIGEFIVGQYGNFDALARKAVEMVKKRYPNIRLVLLLPYLKSFEELDRAAYDELLYPEGMETVPPRYAIARANRYALMHSDMLIVYVKHSYGNAASLFAMAERKGLPVYRIT